MATNPKPPPGITEVDEIDPRLIEADEYDPDLGDDDVDDVLAPSEALTTTESLHRHALYNAETVDQIVDLGVEVLDPQAETHIVRVHTDIGPIYYGDTNRPIELKKNRRYEVPASIYRYLYERGLMVDQLADNQI